jgi:uncharacterized protein (DUF1501 family)
MAGVGAGTIALRPTAAGAQDDDAEEGDDGGGTFARTGAVVVVHLVGGLDGMSLVVPHTSNDYYRLRPSIAIAPPGEPGGAIPFVADWGLHPALAPLVNDVGTDAFAVVAGVGHPDTLHNRSHRLALRRLHRGGLQRGHDGWGTRLLGGDGLGGALAWTPDDDGHPVFRGLSGLNAGQGFVTPTAHFDDPGRAVQALAAAYAGTTAIDAAGREAIGRSVRAAQISWSSPADRGYPSGSLGSRLAGAADVLRSPVGVRVLAVDHEGYDTHADQGDGVGGVLAVRLDELASALAAFWSDLGPLSNDVTVVAVSEFGRQVQENRRGGTNHGRGGAALVLDRSIVSGIHVPPDTRDPELERGAWPVTVDVHQLLADVMASRGLNPWIGDDDDAPFSEVGVGDSIGVIRVT